MNSLRSQGSNAREHLEKKRVAGRLDTFLSILPKPIATTIEGWRNARKRIETRVPVATEDDLNPQTPPPVPSFMGLFSTDHKRVLHNQTPIQNFKLPHDIATLKSMSDLIPAGIQIKENYHQILSTNTAVKPNDVKEGYSDILEDIEQIRTALTKAKREYAQLAFENKLPANLNQFYQDQLDNIAAALANYEITIQTNIAAYSGRVSQIPSSTTETMSENEFIQKLASLDILYKAIKRPSTPERLRVEFYNEGKALLAELDYVLDQKKGQEFPRAATQRFKHIGFYLDFKKLERTGFADLASAANAPLLHPNKAHYLALLDKLEYLASRLEANPSIQLGAKFKTEGQGLLTSLNQLQQQRKNDWRLDESEQQRADQIMQRYELAHKQYNQPMIVRTFGK